MRIALAAGLAALFVAVEPADTERPDRSSGLPMAGMDDGAIAVAAEADPNGAGTPVAAAVRAPIVKFTIVRALAVAACVYQGYA